jgi:hypothetical protein
MKRQKTTTLIVGFTIVLCALLAPKVQAQVTIGSLSEAKPTMLLDLKTSESNDFNSSKGLVYPRVELEQIDMLYPMFSSSLDYLSNKTVVDEKHTGLTVYNIKNNATFSEGIYQWDGEKWDAINNSELTPAATGDIDCSGVRLYPEIYKAGTPYKGVLVVPYFNGNGGYYTTGTVINDNNFTIRLRPGKLSNGYGELYFEVTSNSPIFSSPAKTRINIYNLLGNSTTCQNILVGGEEDGVPSLYLKRTGKIHGRTNGNTWDATIRNIGHLKIGYRYNVSTERVQFGSTQNVHCSYYWLKSGDGGLDFWAAGEFTLKGNTSISTTNDIKDFGDGQTANGGPSGNKANMRNANRDIGQAWIVFFHSDYTELYRSTVNAHEKLGATKEGYITFFTEFMQ